MACTIACAGFFLKALSCQNSNHFDIPTNIPTIGLDPVVDTCLCQQSVIPSMHSCASCRNRNNITNGDATWVFLDACQRLYPERRLWLPPGSSAPPGTRPWGVKRKKTRTTMAPTTTKAMRVGWTFQKMVESVNVCSALLVVSLATSVCSVMLAG